MAFRRSSNEFYRCIVPTLSISSFLRSTLHRSYALRRNVAETLCVLSLDAERLEGVPTRSMGTIFFVVERVAFLADGGLGVGGYAIEGDGRKKQGDDCANLGLALNVNLDLVLFGDRLDDRQSQT